MMYSSLASLTDIIVSRARMHIDLLTHGTFTLRLQRRQHCHDRIVSGLTLYICIKFFRAQFNDRVSFIPFQHLGNPAFELRGTALFYEQDERSLVFIKSYHLLSYSKRNTQQEQ